MKRRRFSQRAKPLTRLKNTRNLRRILVVCEGEKTEPNYFKKFPDNPDVYDQINIYGIGYNTISLVNEAIRLKTEALKRKEPYIEVWCVFDKDDFPVDQFQNAITLAKSNHINCAYSIEAFELWYMLHFNFYDAVLSRDQYKEKLSGLLNRPYRKNDDNIYSILHRRLKIAMKNARKLYALQHNQSVTNQNPITTVFLLVERLIGIS